MKRNSLPEQATAPLYLDIAGQGWQPYWRLEDAYAMLDAVLDERARYPEFSLIERNPDGTYSVAEINTLNPTAA